MRSTGAPVVRPFIFRQAVGPIMRATFWTTGTISMRAFLLRLTRREEGATMIEYAFIGILISVAIFSVVASIGTSVNGLFLQVVNGF
jgi:Flp pilus assembly pilin Flp